MRREIRISFRLKFARVLIYLGVIYAHIVPVNYVFMFSFEEIKKYILYNSRYTLFILDWEIMMTNCLKVLTVCFPYE